VCGTVFTEIHTATYEKQRLKLKAVFKNMSNTSHLMGKRSVEDALRLAKLALVTSQILESKPSVLASLCMKIAWFCRYSGNTAEENKFLEHSAGHYEKVYYSSDDSLPEANVMFMLGELNYRVNGYEKARPWFGKLIGMDKSNPMVKKGIERWQDIKMEEEKNRS
jgi:uncharacterized protein (DUF2225 family)